MEYTTDRIQIANNEIVELKGGVTNNKITLLAKKVGNTKVEIFTADNRSRGSFEVSVYTLANTLKLAYKADIPHYKTGITDKEEYKRLIEETLVAYEKLMLELEGLEKYPTDKQYYSKQNDLYLEGIRISREAKQFYKGKKDTANIHELENTYENLHQYGVGYAEVEIMIRIAEQYRKKYPNNTEIEKLIKENFNGGYTSLDGPSLTNYLNNNIVTTFNKIIDIVNSLQ
ncbi:GAG-binding domain-containing protein [Capnocytophaga sp. G2]|uniref:GAG-binding domain-containing protein n=1 Tax=Capnocytophaga sp. G2 TaxID=3110695 RepID=UPI002B49C267|nr:GAG-binding domain-containing protein [Capnocytophaga sp. G2]MEB3005641.1 GAG-binding domain-containing protein [Capnocytophaga sp. G2]